MSVMRVGAAFGFLLGLGLVVGCGSSGPDTGELSGAVNYDGKPVTDGSITFFATDGKSPSTGGTIKDGKYTASKVPVGTVKVSISAVKVIGKKKAYNTPDSPEVPVTEPLIPEKYNTKSDLKYDVKAGAQTKDFELTK